MTHETLKLLIMLVYYMCNVLNSFNTKGIPPTHQLSSTNSHKTFLARFHRIERRKTKNKGRRRGQMTDGEPKKFHHNLMHEALCCLLFHNKYCSFRKLCSLHITWLKFNINAFHPAWYAVCSMQHMSTGNVIHAMRDL